MTCFIKSGLPRNNIDALKNNLRLVGIVRCRGTLSVAIVAAAVVVVGVDDVVVVVGSFAISKKISLSFSKPLSNDGDNADAVGVAVVVDDDDDGSSASR